MAELSTAQPRPRARRPRRGLGAAAGREQAATPGGAAGQGARYARLYGAMAVVFAVLLVMGLVLVHRSPALSAPDSAYAAFTRGCCSSPKVVGTDDNPSYRAYYDTSGLSPETPISVEALVTDNAGHVRSSAPVTVKVG